MKEETRELFKENLVRISRTMSKARERVRSGWPGEKLVKLYFAAPPKIQFVLAKFVMKAVLNKSKRPPKDIIRH